MRESLLQYVIFGARGNCDGIGCGVAVVPFVMRSRIRRGLRVQRDRLESRVLKHSDRTSGGSCQFDGPLDELAGEIGKVEKTVDLPRQVRERIGAAAMLLGLVEVVRNFQGNRNLCRERTGAANILLRDACVVEAIKHAKHADDPSIGTQ